MQVTACFMSQDSSAIFNSSSLSAKTMSITQDAKRQMIMQQVNSQVSRQGYASLKAVRLSYETNKLNQVSYQGITKAGTGKVARLIKWQLKLKGASCPSSLDIEMANIKQLQQQCQNQKSYQTLIEYQFIKTSTVDIQGELWQLSGLVMPYFNLGSLKHYLQGYQLADHDKLHLALKLAECVQQAHQLGWIHGDIKPSNFLLSTSQESKSSLSNNTGLKVYLNDWSCAQPQSAGSELNEIFVNEINQKVKGTPAYLAPECWQGQPITVQSDLYAFGVTLFELFAANRPYQVQQPEAQKQRLSSQWARLHCQQPIPLLPKQWQRLQPLIDKLLAKRTENRLKTIEEAIKLIQVFHKNAEDEIY